MAKVVITFKSTCTLKVPDSAESLRKLYANDISQGNDPMTALLDVCHEHHDLTDHIAAETYVDDIQIED